jgi:hypothetical protein
VREKTKEKRRLGLRMGNNVSEVNDSLKAQAGGEGGPELYKYVDVKGGGLLIKLMKVADVTKDYAEFDEILTAVIATYLYEGGQGMEVGRKRGVWGRRREEGCMFASHGAYFSFQLYSSDWRML